MDILILGGFLGAGKTTLLLKLVDGLREQARNANRKEPAIAILENEIGSVGIDDQLIEDRGYAVSSVLSGCACCTATTELTVAVRGIMQDMDPDLLIIEGSGVAFPDQIRDSIQNIVGISGKICTLADSSRWMRIRVPLETMLVPQIKAADLICMSKADLIDAQSAEAVEQSIREINELAPIVKIASSDPEAGSRIACEVQKLFEKDR